MDVLQLCKVATVDGSELCNARRYIARNCALGQYICEIVAVTGLDKVIKFYTFLLTVC